MSGSATGRRSGTLPFAPPLCRAARRLGAVYVCVPPPALRGGQPRALGSGDREARVCGLGGHGRGRPDPTRPPPIGGWAESVGLLGRFRPHRPACLPNPVRDIGPLFTTREPSGIESREVSTLWHLKPDTKTVPYLLSAGIVNRRVLSS